MKKITSFLALALLAIPLAVYAQTNNGQSGSMGQQMQNSGNTPMMMCCPMCMQMMNGNSNNVSMQDHMKSMRQMHQNMGNMMDQMHKDCNGNYDDCPAMQEHMKEMQQIHKDMGMGDMHNNKWHNKWMGNNSQ